MRDDPAPRRVALDLSLAYAAGFLCYGIFTPYLPVWLQQRGLSPEQIGLMLAIPLALRVVALLPLTQAADRLGRLRDVILVCTGLSIVAFAALSWSSGLAWLAVGVALAFFFYNPVVPLLDAYALTAAAARGLDYPRMRLWGSASFVAANIVGGALIGWFSGSIVPLLCAATCVPLLLVTARLPSFPGPSRTRAGRGEGWRVLRLPGLMPVLLGASMVQGSHGLYYSFSAAHWQAQGYSGTLIGLLWAAGVIAEIGLMWRAHRWLMRFGASRFLILGAVAGIVRWSLMALDPGPVPLVLLQLLHAGTFAATFLGAMAIIAQRVPPELAGSGQGIAAMTTALATMVVTLVSGLLWAAFDVRAYLAAALLSAIGLMVLLGAGIRWRTP